VIPSCLPHGRLVAISLFSCKNAMLDVDTKPKKFMGRGQSGAGFMVIT
jgi:hypothetical protein